MVQKALEKLRGEIKKASSGEKAMGQALEQLLQMTEDRALAERICDPEKTLAELYKDMEALARRRKAGNVGAVSMMDIYAWYGVEFDPARCIRQQKEEKGTKPQTSAGMVDLMEMEW